jgi:large subunit ribosomal protein L9
LKLPTTPHSRAKRGEECAGLLSSGDDRLDRRGDDGRLFGSVTPQDIVDAISESRGLELDRRGIALEEPIKNVGTYMVVVEVSAGVTATVKTIVTAA